MANSSRDRRLLSELLLARDNQMTLCVAHVIILGAHAHDIIYLLDSLLEYESTRSVKQGQRLLNQTERESNEQDGRREGRQNPQLHQKAGEESHRKGIGAGDA